MTYNYSNYSVIWYGMKWPITIVITVLFGMKWPITVVITVSFGIKWPRTIISFRKYKCKKDIPCLKYHINWYALIGYDGVFIISRKFFFVHIEIHFLSCTNLYPVIDKQTK